MFNVLTYRTDSFFLIISVCYLIAYFNSIELFAYISASYELFKVGFGEKSADFSLGRRKIVPEICIKAIGSEHHRPSAKLSFKTISIQTSLLPAIVCIFSRAFCFNNSKGQTIFSEKYIIGIAFLSKHAVHIIDFVFFNNIFIHAVKLPAHRFKINVNIAFSCFPFGKIHRRKASAVLFCLFVRRKTC